jgi:hypothetical protein
VIFEETENGVMIRPMNADYFKLFKGILKSTGNLREEMHELKKKKKAGRKKFNPVIGKKIKKSEIDTGNRR